jgi:hypothetical protein
MDFLNRSANQPQPGRVATQPAAPAPASHQPQPSKGNGYKGPISWVQPGWLRVIFVVLLFSVTGLAVAVALLLNKTSTPAEISYVNASKYQAVFLTNGQVYFGKVKGITKTYVDLQDIYYLNSQQSTDNKATTPTSFSLVKLGCELHGPNDQMVINRDQITFWENLKDDRQVAKAIAQWQQQNPDGQKCEDAPATGTQQSGSNSSQSTQNTSTNNTSSSTQR